MAEADSEITQEPTAEEIEEETEEEPELPQWFIDLDDKNVEAPRYGPDGELIQTWTRSKFKFEL